MEALPCAPSLASPISCPAASCLRLYRRALCGLTTRARAGQTNASSGLGCGKSARLRWREATSRNGHVRRLAVLEEVWVREDVTKHILATPSGDKLQEAGLLPLGDILANDEEPLALDGARELSARHPHRVPATPSLALLIERDVHPD